MKRWTSTLIAAAAGLLVVAALSPASAEPRLPKPAAVTSHRSGPPTSAIPPLESTFVPIAACRILNTQNSSAGQVKGKGVRPVYVRGTTGFAGQGGNAAGCGIPSAATGVTANVQVSRGKASGSMSAVPTGSAPAHPFAHYPKHGISMANPTFALAGNGLEPSMTLKAGKNAPADVTIDVTGYYLPQIEALINPTGSIYSGSPRVLSVTKVSTGYFQVDVDSNVNYCTPMIHTYYPNEYATATTVSGSSVYVRVWYLNPTTHLETPVDDYFYLTVTC